MSIVLEHVCKRLGGRLVVDDVSLEIPAGELFVLLGASGSGKSTLLRLIAGLLQPDSGRILLEGRDVTALPPQRRGTGFVFQNYSVFRHMSVAGNVEFGLKLRRVGASERARRRDELLQLVGLSGFSGRYPEELSGGQQQRVALARALAYSPNVLLLDEPFGALDVRIRVQLRRSLREIQRRLKLTTILVTHDQDEAFEVADRLGVIERGRLLEVGLARELYRRPQSLFVGTFLGASNVIVGRAAGGQACFGPLSLPIPEHAPHGDGAPVRLLFRPEEVVLSEQEPPAGTPVLGRGRITDPTFAGAWVRVRLRLPALPDTRQIAPVSGFGEEGLLVDAVLPAETPLPEAAWASLRAWRILEPRPMRLLVTAAPAAAIALARELVIRAGARAQVIAVERRSSAAGALRAEVEQRLAAQGLPGADVLVRTGKPLKEIRSAQAEGNYDLLILGIPESARGRVPSELLKMLQQTPVPVLVVQGARSRIRRVLICTAGGEPGKNDVQVGGRVAQLLGATATVLHVRRDTGAPDRLEREHLDRAADSLRSFGLQADVHVGSAESPAAGILSAVNAGDPDLVVLGTHRPPARAAILPENVTVQVLADVGRHVLVVPSDASL